MKLDVHPPLVRPIRRSRAPFDAHTGRCSVGLQISRDSQTRYEAGEDALVTPTLPEVMQRLFAGLSSSAHPTIATRCDC